LKILLIQPPDPPKKQIIRDHMGRFGIVKRALPIKDDILPPLDLAYSASLLEKNDFDVNIIDSPALSLNPSKTLKMVANEKPDMIFVSTSAVSIDSDLNFANNLKKITDSFVTVTGSYLTVRPEIALKKRNIDLVVRGEIESTVLEICKKKKNINSIKGIAYKKNKKIVVNPKRDLIKNLDTLPFPSYHLLPMKKYSYKLLNKKPFTTMLSSRGCPFGCIYCPYPIGYGDVWRGRSPENVISELRMLVEEYKIKSILFRDQVFTFDMKRTEKICDGIIREGLDLQWRCETRVDRLEKRLMKKMKNAGCQAIHLGVESGDPDILKNYAKVGLSLERIRKTFKNAKDVGLETVAFFMIGFPGETKESVKKTLELARELNSDINWFTVAAPYPGTKLYDMAKREGWILTENLEKYSGREVVMRTDKLSEEDIKKLLRTAKILFTNDTIESIRKLFSKDGIISTFLGPEYLLKRISDKRDELSR